MTVSVQKLVKCSRGANHRSLSKLVDEKKTKKKHEATVRTVCADSTWDSSADTAIILVAATFSVQHLK